MAARAFAVIPPASLQLALNALARTDLESHLGYLQSVATGDAEQAMRDFNMIRVVVNDDVERRVRPVVERYERQIAAQQAVIDRLRFLSPAVLMQDALSDLAGTGMARHRHFLAQVDRFHAHWRAYFTPLIFQRAQVTSFDEVPRFVFVEEATGDVARRAGVGVAGLGVPAAILAWAGLRRLRRYPVAG
ncbi:MAG: DUF3526 domain-containing protein [Acidobacteriota bacterium]